MDLKPIPLMENGIGYCQEKCPCHDGKRCEILGFRPDRICEPWVRALVEGSKKFTADSVPLPQTLDRVDVRAAIAEWFTYRREIKAPLKSLGAWKKQLAKLAEWGPLKAIASIQQSIANQWQGLFEPRTDSRNPDAHIWQTISEGMQ